MSDPSRIVETLKAKAMLLIQREREVFALRLGRERVMAWLHAFHRLSMQTKPEAGISTCAEWTAVMIEELHFQTAAAFTIDSSTGELSLIDGLSHAPIRKAVALDEAGQRVLRERRDGFFEGSNDPALEALARTLGLRSFLWFVFPTEAGKEILLVAGVAEGINGSQGAALADDVVYFTMLGRHLAVLLSNAALIAALESATSNLRELFDHMRQAIVAFDATGTIRGVSSRQARLLFERENLEGCSLRDLLYPTAPEYDLEASSFSEWLDVAMRTKAEDWASCERYAPREAIVATKTGGSVPLELEFRPLIRNGAINQLMLLASDVSEARRLEEVVQTHEAERASRIAAMRRLIAGGTQVFLSFVDTARAALDRGEAVLRDHSGSLPVEAIDELFRIAHTIRGEARAFDLLELEGATKALEEDLDELREAVPGVPEPQAQSEIIGTKLETGLQRARRALEEGCEVLVAASPAGAAVFDQVTVQRSALQALIEHARHRSDPVARLVERLTDVPFGVTAAGVVESAPGWALSAGTSVVMHVGSRELLVPSALARVLPGALAHLVRNAIAHGIEPGDERVAAGKPEHGAIRIGAAKGAKGRGARAELETELEGDVTVTVEDDGRGLDVERILARAKGASADAAEIVFLPGVTTREEPDALAGRGVGLDAVRSDLSRIGYAVSVAFAPGQWTRVTIVPSAAKLPNVAPSAWSRSKRGG